MENKNKLDLFPGGKLQITLMRLCHQLIEKYGSFEDTVIIGLQPRGIYMAKRIQALIKDQVGTELPLGDLDTTFYRDDFRKRILPKRANQTKIDFLIEDKHVILIDDVLFTGRSIRAALDAMLAYGRPLSVSLLVLVDRKRKRDLPIEPAFTGIEVDTIETEYVAVELVEKGGKDDVFLVSKKDQEEEA